jgi:hypothetical protein
VQRSIGCRVSGDGALVHEIAVKLFETASRWTPALEQWDFRKFGNISEAAAIGIFQ